MAYLIDFIIARYINKINIRNYTKIKKCGIINMVKISN